MLIQKKRFADMGGDGIAVAPHYMSARIDANQLQLPNLYRNADIVHNIGVEICQKREGKCFLHIEVCARTFQRRFTD